MADVLRIKTSAAKEVVDLTDRVEAMMRKTKLQEGLCALFVMLPIAALTTEDDLGDRIETVKVFKRKDALDWSTTS